MVLTLPPQGAIKIEFNTNQATLLYLTQKDSDLKIIRSVLQTVWTINILLLGMEVLTIS